MKYQKIFISLVLASGFAACSQMEEDMAAGLDPASEAVENAAFIGGNSDVEIRLASRGAATRAIVNPVDGDGNFETTDGIGVFMLATDITTVNPEANPILWKEYNDGQRHAKTIVLNNVQSNAVINTSETPNITNIVWTDGAVRYYPIDNWYAFRFYGYHPYQNDARVTVTDNELVTVSFPEASIDGSYDILYGQSKKADSGEPEKWRYSAKYIRRTGDTDLPQLKFKHKLMAFQFKVEGVPDYNGSYDDVNKLTVTGLTVGNVPSGDATLTLANRSNMRANDATAAPTTASEEGYLSFNWNNGYRTLSVKKDGNANLDMQIVASATSEPQECGDMLLLPVPPASQNHLYTVDINMHFDDGSATGVDFGTDVPIQLHFADAFEEGKKYVVTLQIAGPQQIQVNATLEDWVDGTESTPIELN